MATPQQRANEPVIRAEGEVLGKEEIPRQAEEEVARAASSSTVRFFAALCLAAIADITQFVLLPFFGEGIASPLNDALDVLVALMMVTLLGFHWQFLPSFASELVPILNIAPAWTIAVVWVYRTERARDSQPG